LVLWNGTDGLPRRDVAWGFVALGVVVEVDVSKGGQSQALARKSLSLQWLNREEVVGIEKKREGNVSQSSHIYVH
jgi:allophanate hydrolase subunit 2